MDKKNLQISNEHSSWRGSGLSRGAYATAMGMSVADLLRVQAGQIPVPQRMHTARQRERDRHGNNRFCEVWIATRGPRGQIRWHYYTTWENEIKRLLSWGKSEKRPARHHIELFTTSDWMLVGVNMETVVSMVVGCDLVQPMSPGDLAATIEMVDGESHSVDEPGHELFKRSLETQ